MQDELTLLRAGDEQAFRALVTKHHATLVRVALVFVKDPALAQEVAQETWANALAQLAQFEGRSSLKTWLFRICANRAKTRAMREARTTPFSAFEEPGDDAPPQDRFDKGGHWSEPPRGWEDGTPEAILLRKEALEKIGEELARLPAAQRAVLTLRDIEGLDAEEACNILEVSETNQRVLLHRARTRIRRALAALYGDEG